MVENGNKQVSHNDVWDLIDDPLTKTFDSVGHWSYPSDSAQGSKLTDGQWVKYYNQWRVTLYVVVGKLPKLLNHALWFIKANMPLQIIGYTWPNFPKRSQLYIIMETLSWIG